MLAQRTGPRLLRVADMPALQSAGPEDLAAIVGLLDANGLLTADLVPQSATRFLVAKEGREIEGVIGLERYGDVGLLRSLAVRPERRRAGLGAALTTAVERHAAAEGLNSLVLLTNTAQAFFASRGYEVIARADAPRSVQSSGEFKSQCCASAVCMMKTLDPR